MAPGMARANRLIMDGAVFHLTVIAYGQETDLKNASKAIK